MKAIALHANDLILFARVVEAGSFTRAGEHTGIPKATLSRRLSALENELGERLLQRSTRRLVLTEFGERMLEHARRLADESEAATALAQHRKASPQGTLRVSFPPEFRELSVVAIVQAFSKAYPQVRLELDLSSRRVDLVAERFDAAIRAAERLPDDATLVARTLTVLENGLYASPAYLARHGRPDQPEDLLAHRGLVLATAGGEVQPWRLQSGEKRWQGQPTQALQANSMGLQQALAIQGMGIVALSERFADAEVRAGRLERVLSAWRLPRVTVWCVTPGRKLLPRRTQAFIETAREVLAPDQPRA